MWGLQLVHGKKTWALVLNSSCGLETTTSSEPSSTHSEVEELKKEASEMEEWATAFSDLLRAWLIEERSDPLIKSTAEKINEFNGWA